ncbi:RteC domain-containing protein [Pinibacter aurantiacus]|uniref:RteC domain-containing protein n=1 Tax=Pinibacter aurantiacus TaxID=2851599 RepID=A0A9E2S9D3_9BACT|nr:RteC domain-containing protein [Pinibacter aurantiacus]MBV4358791.1 RteC domain-containing protein [Pinibacter aurantiacus]
MEQLRLKIAAYTFLNQEEEINFFKEIKPRFCSKLIYYLKVYRIETRRPTGSNDTQLKYLHKELGRLTHFFDNNLDFYQYYRSGATYLDEKYFLRGNQDIFLTLDSFHFDSDFNFSTSHDFKVAKIHAHELLRIYLNAAVEDLERKDEPPKSTFTPKQPLQWTAPKAALIELLYALQSAGAFNNGATDVKQVASYLEQVFNIDLGNYYRTLQELRIRKESRTAYLELLIEKLIQRMDQSDESPRQFL